MEAAPNLKSTAALAMSETGTGIQKLPELPQAWKKLSLLIHGKLLNCQIPLILRKKYMFYILYSIL